MAQETATSVAQFQQLRNRQNDLYRKNSSAIIAAAKAGRLAELKQLKASRVQLGKNDQEIFAAELKFHASNLSQSEAEKNLVAQTQRANKLVKSISNVTHVINAAASMASILARLIAIL